MMHVVNIQGNTFPENDFDRLISEDKLARMYCEDGRVEEAIALLMHVVSIRKNKLLENDRWRLASEFLLAKEYYKDGKAEKAIALMTHVVQVQETLSDDDYDKLESIKWLALFKGKIEMQG